MKRTHEYHEGPEAFTRFQNAMRKVLAVPHEEIKRRIEAEQIQELHLGIKDSTLGVQYAAQRPSLVWGASAPSARYHMFQKPDPRCTRVSVALPDAVRRPPLRINPTQSVV